LPKAKVASWEVSDAFWQRVEPLVPERPGRVSKKKFQRKAGGGRKSKEARTVFAAVVYVLRTGCPWKALPKEALRQRQCDTQALPGMGARGILPCLVAGGAGRVR
jgi:transposase